jgi:hypothetical protein
VAALIWRPWALAFQDLRAGLEAVLSRPGSSILALGRLLLCLLAAWFIYVPLHELLHALGCLAGGGSVEELKIAPRYGGALLERIIPFVKAGGGYAGRLTRFDTKGSDLTYLLTDAAPFLLTVAFGITSLRLARRKGNPALLAVGAVLATAPLQSFTGDFYEIGSILLSRLLGLLPGSPPEAVLLKLRHDDLLALAAEFPMRFPHQKPAWAAAIAAGLITGGLLATLTMSMSCRVAARLGSGPAPAVRHVGVEQVAAVRQDPPSAP